jgi:hypothetical protein
VPGGAWRKLLRRKRTATAVSRKGQIASGRIFVREPVRDGQKPDHDEKSGRRPVIDERSRRVHSFQAGEQR